MIAIVEMLTFLRVFLEIIFIWILISLLSCADLNGEEVGGGGVWTPSLQNSNFYKLHYKITQKCAR